jgi:hypothetical protein
MNDITPAGLPKAAGISDLEDVHRDKAFVSAPC